MAVRPAVRLGDGGTDEKTGGRDGGGRIEDVMIFVRSDKNGQYQEGTAHVRRYREKTRQATLRWFGQCVGLLRRTYIIVY